MQYLMNLVRSFLKWIVLFLDWLTRPEPVKRSPDEQEVVESELEKMALYQFEG